MFVEGLFSLLTNDPGVKALLGNGGVWANVAPDEPLLPYVVYAQVHSEPVISFQGTNPTTELRFQLGCYGNPYKQAKQLANAVKNVLDGFTGALGDPDNTFLEQSIRISEHDETEPDFTATLYAVVLDYHFIVNSPR